MQGFKTEEAINHGNGRPSARRPGTRMQNQTEEAINRILHGTGSDGRESDGKSFDLSMGPYSPKPQFAASSEPNPNRIMSSEPKMGPYAGPLPRMEAIGQRRAEMTMGGKETNPFKTPTMVSYPFSTLGNARSRMGASDAHISWTPPPSTATSSSCITPSFKLGHYLKTPAATKHHPVDIKLETQIRHKVLVDERTRTALWHFPAPFLARMDDDTVLKSSPFSIGQGGERETPLELYYQRKGTLDVFRRPGSGGKEVLLMVTLQGERHIASMTEKHVRLHFNVTPKEDAWITLYVCAFESEREVRVRGRTATWTVPQGIWQCLGHGQEWHSHSFKVENINFQLAICPQDSQNFNVQVHAGDGRIIGTPISFQIAIGTHEASYDGGIQPSTSLRFPLQCPSKDIPIIFTLTMLGQDRVVDVNDDEGRACWRLTRDMVDKSEHIPKTQDFELQNRLFQLALSPANRDRFQRRDLHISSWGAAGKFRLFVRDEEITLKPFPQGEDVRVELNCFGTDAADPGTYTYTIELEYVKEDYDVEVNESIRAARLCMTSHHNIVHFSLANVEWIFEKEGQRLGIKISGSSTRVLYLLKIGNDIRRFKAEFGSRYWVFHDLLIDPEDAVGLVFAIVLVEPEKCVTSVAEGTQLTGVLVEWTLRITPSWEKYFKPDEILRSDSFMLEDVGPLRFQFTPQIRNSERYDESLCEIIADLGCGLIHDTVVLTIKSSPVRHSSPTLPKKEGDCSMLPSLSAEGIRGTLPVLFAVMKTTTIVSAHLKKKPSARHIDIFAPI